MSIASAKLAASATMVLSLGTLAGCGAGSSSTTSSEGGTSAQMFGGGSAGVTIGTSGATGVGATGGMDTAPTAGAANGGSGSSTVVGKSCSPLGGVECSADGAQILFCRSDSTWALKETCAAGLVCDPNAIATSGTCDVPPTPPSPDPVCAGKTSAFCDSGYLYECDASGFITYQSVCPSRACDGNSCMPWDACVAYEADKNVSPLDIVFDAWCVDKCGAVSTVKCQLASTGSNANGITASPYSFVEPDRPRYDWDAGIPGSSTWLKAAACPAVRIFVVASASTMAIRLDVPEPYWVVTSTADPYTTAGYAEAANAACTGTPLVSPVRVTFGYNPIQLVAVIATRDPNAPPFWLQMTRAD